MICDMLRQRYSGYLIYLYIFTVAVLLVIPNKGSDITIDDIHVLDLLRLDYLLHVLLFIPFVPLSRMTWPGSRWWTVIGIGLLFAACAEFLHLLLPYRGYNINDLFSNMAGVLAGAGIALVIDALAGSSGRGR